eukprot:TRINITY_DN95861_c0_g1_i1.p1 TRINITY_DN95861_c0_g1~~TRINITY_DN95861_c0_g1_i1.p1  ORF type:complete len:508 (-),score=109.10 TRINITY_DN95861_c0_g1_i1:3-1526(-)
MSQFVRRVAKTSAKVGLFGGSVLGAAKLTHLFINDDLDDIKYAVTRRFYKLQAKDNERKKVVVLGTGWGALSFVKKLDATEYDVTVVSPRPFFFYTPLLVGSSTGVLSPGAIIEPLRDNAPDCDYLRVACHSVDVENRKVFCDNDVTLDYDHLVVAVGAQPNTFGIPGVEKHGMFLKEIEHGRSIRKKLLDNIERADVAYATGNMEKVKQLLNFVVVGGGPTGVEFCAELSDFIKQDLFSHYPKIKDHFQVTLVEAMPSLVTMFDKKVGKYVQDHLTSQGVDVKLNSMVKEVQEGVVSIKTKEGVTDVDYGLLVWVAGIGMRPFTRKLCESIGIENGQKDRRGIVVDECLRVKGARPGEIFAIGDCAFSGKPPTAQVAYQQGKYLGRMFRLGQQQAIADPEATPFKYNHQGSMAYIGEGQGAAEISPDAFIKLGESRMTDHAWWRTLYGEESQIRFMGPGGFAVWRATYFAKLVSARNRWAVASDWMRTGLYGRPSSSSSQGTLESF